jgi:hypothetical protein
MVQTQLNGKPLTELERLKQKRMILYNELINDIQTHEIFLRQKTETYKQKVKDIDVLIKKLEKSDLVRSDGNKNENRTKEIRKRK